jgi:dihydrofolate reductase
MKKHLPLSLIAALGENRVIGVDNSMPWHLPGDFKYFKATTLGKPIIMGRKTWDSLGRPLPGRLNIVVTRQAGLQLEGAEVFTSLEAAVERAEEWATEQGVGEVMLIGGAQLYAQGLAQADRLYLTRVALSPEGDAWFPEFDQAQWKRVSDTPNPAMDDKPAYSFEVWERRQIASSDAARFKRSSRDRSSTVKVKVARIGGSELAHESVLIFPASLAPERQSS